MSDPNLTPPLPEGEPSWTPPPAPPAPPSAPVSPPAPPSPTAPQYPAPPSPPGQWGPPPTEQYGAPGQYGAPPQGQWGAPPPGQYGGPPPPGQWGAPPPPGGFQAPALPYQPGLGVPLTGELATPGKRIAARIIDWLIMAAVLIPIYIVVIAASSTSSSTSSEFSAGEGIALGGFLAITLLLTVGQALYEIAFTAVKGATPGKMLMKVRVVREADGQIPGWGPAFMRWVPTLVSLVPCIGSFLSLGLWIWALVNLFNNSRRQTPFDLAAKTLVIDASHA